MLHCVDWNNLLSQLCFDCTTITGYKVTFTSANEGAIDTKTLPVLFALKDYLQKYLIHLYMFIEKKTIYIIAHVQHVTLTKAPKTINRNERRKKMQKHTKVMIISKVVFISYRCMILS